jgi:hypothetical protein
MFHRALGAVSPEDVDSGLFDISFVSQFRAFNPFFFLPELHFASFVITD